MLRRCVLGLGRTAFMVHTRRCWLPCWCASLSVFSSSATVYGSALPPVTETSSTGVGILNPYGQTKFMLEQILRDVHVSDPTWGVILLRYFNPVGAHAR